MGLRFIRISPLASPRLLYVFYILPVEGVSHYQQISIQRWIDSSPEQGAANVEETEKS